MLPYFYGQDVRLIAGASPRSWLRRDEGACLSVSSIQPFSTVPSDVDVDVDVDVDAEVSSHVSIFPMSVMSVSWRAFPPSELPQQGPADTSG